MIGQREPYVNAFHLLRQARAGFGHSSHRAPQQRAARTKPSTVGAAERTFPATTGHRGMANRVQNKQFLTTLRGQGVVLDQRLRKRLLTGCKRFFRRPGGGKMALTIVKLAQGMPVRVTTRFRVGGRLQPPQFVFPAFRARQRPDQISQNPDSIGT